MCLQPTKNLRESRFNWNRVDHFPKILKNSIYYIQIVLHTFTRSKSNGNKSGFGNCDFNFN